MKFYDLFAGIGGFHLGMERAGHECVGACEIDDAARKVYSYHWPDITIDTDAVKLERPPRGTDIICAGFPCQAFSIAGHRLGFKDTRGSLFFEIIRLAKNGRVPYLLLENVKGLLNHDDGRTFETILRTLDECRFDAQWQCINSKYHVPQNRERVFIVCNLRDKPRPQILPYREGGKEPDGALKPPPSQGQRVRGAYSRTIDAHYHKGGGTRTMIQMNPGASQGYRLYDTAGTSCTLTAQTGGLGAKTGLYQMSDNKIRTLTPTECERLQGFPDGHTIPAGSDTARYRCIGNSVTVPVIEWLGRRLHI